MAKRSGGFGVALADRDPKVPAYRWLYGALRDAILRGQLRRGARLPSTRDLALQYGVSRGTVVTAFGQLHAEGYVDGAVGSGTYVNQVLPDELLEVAAPAGARGARVRTPPRLASYAGRLVPFPANLRPTRAFRPNLPAIDQFPMTLWAQLASRRLRSASTRMLLGCDAMGYPPLREAVAAYLATSRGVNCEAGQVMIVSGVQEAIALVARLVLDPGDVVYVEEPGYRGATALFESVGARLVTGAVDDEGLTLSRAPPRGMRLVYVTPAHQFPLGVAMSLPRRLALLEWARSAGALVFEDDYDSEYRYAGRPLPALQGLDRAGCVLFAGGFNKMLFPALRLGYLVLPAELVDRFSAARSLTVRHLPLFEQTVVCDFISEGHFGRHLRRMREVYAERLSVLLERARDQLGGLLELSPIEAGMQTIGWLADGLGGEAVAAAALARDVEVVALHRFYRGPFARDGLQLGFGAVSPRELRRGVTELAAVLEQQRRSSRRRRPPSPSRSART